MAPVLVVRPVERFRLSIAKPKDYRDESTKFGVVTPETDADDIAEFVHNLTGIEINVFHDPMEQCVALGAWLLCTTLTRGRHNHRRWHTAVVVAVTCGILAACVAAHPQRLCCWRHTCFWLALSWAVFFIAVSGMIMCIIRQPQWCSDVCGVAEC